ncbi:hypothetical protein ABZ876_23545 [Streptomyces sp. NPDC046931]|uniref:hypothetical protein n=1 Tax=Streptomyces sp. NPDC046931 TaxID=3154806 RepID=UPI0033F95B39
MSRRKKGAPRAEAFAVELCDLCAAAFPGGDAVRGCVPDSSSARRGHDWFDGLRLVTACSDAHFQAVRETYRHRPFVAEELWAAKITRALTTGPPVLSLVHLACRTGLQESQIRRAVAWHNERLRGQRRVDP